MGRERRVARLGQGAGALPGRRDHDALRQRRPGRERSDRRLGELRSGLPRQRLVLRHRRRLSGLAPARDGRLHALHHARRPSRQRVLQLEHGAGNPLQARHTRQEPPRGALVRLALRRFGVGPVHVGHAEGPVLLEQGRLRRRRLRIHGHFRHGRDPSRKRLFDAGRREHRALPDSQEPVVELRRRDDRRHGRPDDRQRPVRVRLRRHARHGGLSGRGLRRLCGGQQQI